MILQHEVQRVLELRYVQNWNAWFYQGSLLETEEAIFEEVTLRLCIAVRVCNANQSKQHQTFSSLRLSARSSPNCTVGWSSGTTCFPSLRPAKPDCFIFCCIAILRSSRSFSFSDIFRAIDFLILLIAPKDISMRFRAARSASARFFEYHQLEI